MARAPKSGRPPKPARLKRTRRLQLLLTAAERKALDEYAARREMTVSEIIRGYVHSLLHDHRKEEGGGL